MHTVVARVCHRHVRRWLAAVGITLLDREFFRDNPPTWRFSISMNRILYCTLVQSTCPTRQSLFFVIRHLQKAVQLTAYSAALGLVPGSATLKNESTITDISPGLPPTTCILGTPHFRDSKFFSDGHCSSCSATCSGHQVRLFFSQDGASLDLVVLFSSSFGVCLVGVIVAVS